MLRASTGRVAHEPEAHPSEIELIALWEHELRGGFRVRRWARLVEMAADSGVSTIALDGTL